MLSLTARLRNFMLGHFSPDRKTLHIHAAATLVRLAVCLLAMFAGQAFAESKNLEIKFENVADSTQGLSQFSQFPAISNRGSVTFVATQNGAPAVFKWDRHDLRTIASTSDGHFTFFSDDVVINGHGIVGFRAGLKAAIRTTGIFTGDGFATRTIINSTDQGLPAFGIGPPSINASGTVAFEASRNFLKSTVIYTGDGRALTPVLDTLTSTFGSFGAVAINASGQIVFRGILKDRNEGVFVATRNPDTALPGESFNVVDIVDSNNPDFFGFGDPVINDAGVIADAGSGPTLLEIFSGDAKGITPRTDPASGVFADFEHPSINNRGAVAFSAFEANGGQGIFVELTGGALPVAVLQSGDPLFGSRVTALSVGRFAFNDHFRLAFGYELEDGRSGIAVASLQGDAGQAADDTEKGDDTEK